MKIPTSRKENNLMWLPVLLQDPYPQVPDPAEIDLNYLANLVDQTIDLLPRLVLALVVFIIGLYLAKLISRIVRRGMEARLVKLQITQLVSRLAYWTVAILFLAMALQTIGFNLTAFLAGLGILGFTVGFALQDVSKNFIAGLLLSLSQPFEIGDTIEVGGYTGIVQTIELRATELRMFDGIQVLIPNADVFTSPLTNFTRNKLRRLEVSVGVAYGSDLEQVRELMIQTIQAVPGVLPDPEPVVLINEFGNSAINCTLFYWINQEETNFLGMRVTGFMTVERALSEAGIEIPYPIQMVYLQQPAPPALIQEH
jgi:small-conductance mechanosensitive channel